MKNINREQPYITIRGRKIGEGYPAYIIAEMSGNHAGSLSRAKEIIKAAKEAGADCIKIQTYTPDTLTIDCDNAYFMVGGGTWDGEKLYDLYGKAYTPWDWQQALKDYADSIGIDFLSTPFDSTSVDFLEAMGLEFYKIASFEMIDLPLLRYVASKKKPIIMSTGMATAEEIKEAIDAIHEAGGQELAILKCSSVYPADPAKMHLKTIADLKERFGLPTGLSDHSMGSLSAVTAVAMGACIIEKHFCLSRSIENPDASFSMEPAEFAQMVADIRRTESALGTPFYGVAEGEESSMVFRRSVFAVEDIPKGGTFTAQNTRIIRPGYGVKPKYFEDILTMEAAEAIQRGTPISFGQMKKGALLFLTNNENTAPLYQWLKEKEPLVYKISNKLTVEMVEALAPSFVISYNYQHIIGADVLALLEGRIINLHTSYLPFNRGASPNFFGFYTNTPKGVTIHKMAVGLDKGEILCQKELFFDEEKETFASSYDKLITAMNELFMENWASLRDGKIVAKAQEGTGSYHTAAELAQIRKAHPFSWDCNIAAYKRGCNLE